MVTNKIFTCKQRLNWLDSMKGFTMLWVILGHALVGYSEQGLFSIETIKYINIAKDFIYFWHMPLFMFLSGISYSLSCGKKDGHKNPIKLKYSLFNLIILYLIFSLLLDGLKLAFSAFVNNPVDPSKILRNLLVPNNIMWYLWVLILFYIIFYFIEDLVPDRVLGVGCFLASASVAVIIQSISISLGIKNLFFTSLFFWAGTHWKTCITFAKNNYISVISAIILCIYIIWYFWGKKLILANGILAVLAPLAICFLLLRIFITWEYIIDTRFLAFIGKNSIIFYLVHTYLVTAFRQAVAKLGISSPILAIIIAFFMPLFINCLIVSVVGHIHILQILFKPALLLKKD